MKERFRTFTALIAKINRNVKKIKNQEMAEYGLRSVHVSCLYYLYSAESLTATELCELCEEDKATISRGVDFLEENVLLFHILNKLLFQFLLRMRILDIYCDHIHILLVRLDEPYHNLVFQSILFLYTCCILFYYI